jgi:hypothetical protein
MIFCGIAISTDWNRWLFHPGVRNAEDLLPDHDQSPDKLREEAQHPARLSFASIHSKKPAQAGFFHATSRSTVR